MLKLLEATYQVAQSYLQQHEDQNAYRRFIRRQMCQQMLDQLLEHAEIQETATVGYVDFKLELAVFDPDNADLNQVAIQRVRELLDKTGMATRDKTDALATLELIERRHA